MLPDMVRIPADDEEQAAKLLREGWREIEILETYEGEFVTDRVRTVAYLDTDRVLAVALRGFGYDRLHADPLADRHEADTWKLDWLKEKCQKKPHTVYVVGTPVKGFVAVTVDRGELIIDLLSVHPDFRGQGYANALVRHACHDTLAKSIRAGTQSDNRPAKAFYESLGLKVVKRERTFHK